MSQSSQTQNQMLEKFSGKNVKLNPRNDTFKVPPSPFRDYNNKSKSPTLMQTQTTQDTLQQTPSQDDKRQMKDKISQTSNPSSKQKSRGNENKNNSDETLIKLKRVKPQHYSKSPYVFYMKACAKYWKNMNNEERKPYTKLAQDDQKRSDKKFDEYMILNDFEQTSEENGPSESNQNSSSAKDSGPEDNQVQDAKEVVDLDEKMESDDLSEVEVKSEPDVKSERITDLDNQSLGSSSDQELEGDDDTDKSQKSGTTYRIPERKSGRTNIDQQTKLKDFYKGTGKRKNYRDPSRPKRIMGAYQFFLREKLKTVKTPEYLVNGKSEDRRGGIVAYLGSLWSKMSDKEKRPFFELHVKDRHRYAQENSEFLDKSFSIQETKAIPKKRFYTERNTNKFFTERIMKQLEDETSEITTPSNRFNLPPNSSSSAPPSKMKVTLSQESVSDISTTKKSTPTKLKDVPKSQISKKNSKTDHKLDQIGKKMQIRDVRKLAYRKNPPRVNKNKQVLESSDEEKSNDSEYSGSEDVKIVEKAQNKKKTNTVDDLSDTLIECFVNKRQKI